MFGWFWKKTQVAHDPMKHAAEAAVVRSDKDGELVRGRWPAIQALSRELTSIREENNFAARIKAAYGEER